LLSLFTVGKLAVTLAANSKKQEGVPAMKKHLWLLVVLGFLCMIGPAGSVAFAETGTRASGAASFNVLHGFGTVPDDGVGPFGGLILSGRTLYGMTTQGGAYGVGTIFEFNPKTGKYTVLYSFQGGTTDGALPFGNLIVKGETLYGMTNLGGANNYGTIFEFNIKTEQYAVLHNFLGGTTDGAGPRGSLILSGRTLYGMTNVGGAYGKGTIFEFNTKTSQYAVLHSFQGAPNDGANPWGNLILSGSTLYGMTDAGGAYGEGTIFEFNIKTSQLTLLQSFWGDGAGPLGSLTISGKNLYGMTYQGGESHAGLLFMVNTKTDELTLLHSFEGGTTDGALPFGSLILSGKTLYGMTLEGGANGLGIIFEFNLRNGEFADLHNFGGADGANPAGSLTLSGKNLYGTTNQGGQYDEGVIFSYSLK